MLNAANLRVSTGTISRFVIFSWIFFIPFSHAPSYKHPLVTFPGILSIIIIILTFLNLKNIYKIFTAGKYQVIYLILIACILSFYWTFPVMNAWNEKYLNFYLAHIWLLLLLFSIYFNFSERDIDEDKAIKILYFTLCISVIYSIAESILPFFRIDIGTYLPRYDRQEYEAGLGFLLFRTRAFNYESGNLAMLFNTAFPIILSRFNNSIMKYSVSGMWALSVLFTYSAFHLTLLFLFFSLLFLKTFFWKLTYARIQKDHLVIIICMILLLAVYYETFETIVTDITYKISAFIHGDTQETSSSGMVRRYLYSIGYQAFQDSIIWGHGYAGFYNYIDSGFNNFYLQLFVQVGLFAIPFISVILFFGYRTLLTNNIYYLFSFIAGWAHLFFIGDFWLPQLFVSVAFTELNLKRKQLNKQNT